VVAKDYRFSFEKLNVWQNTRSFVSFVYKITQKFPDYEKFGITNQIRRAALSVSANIAEGSSRTSFKDQAHFTQLAYSSLMEVLSHFCIALDLDFISKETFELLKPKIYDISNQLNALRSSQLKR
jgi:four helix bundle protein